MNNDDRSSSYSGAQLSTYYADNDGDGYGDPNSSVQDCAAPIGYVTDNTDCDDSDDQVYPGAPCDDLNVCTIGDVLDADCNCSGVLEDSDGDGVCDEEDVCPGGDDNIDENGDGTPDFCECTAAVITFSNTTLEHQGSGSSTTSVALELNSKNAIFTISGLGNRTNGNPNQRFIDEVSVTYLDGDNVEQTFGTFSGNTTNSVDVYIQDIVNSITVELSDGYDGNAPNISVMLSEVEYCTSGVGCSDSDGDGVCDVNDVCPGGDDTIDSDGDGIPDDCDTGCNNEVVSTFDPSNLQHAGTGSSSSILSFPNGNTNALFTISGIGAKLNGNTRRRYEEVIEVYYDNGSGEQLFGEYRGSEVSSIDVSIVGIVDQIRISLSDGYNNGTNNLDLSVQLGDVTSCVESASTLGNPADGVLQMAIAPNPTEGIFMIRFNDIIEVGEVRIMNILGEWVKAQQLQRNHAARIDLRGMGEGIYLIGLYKDSEWVETQRLIVH